MPSSAKDPSSRYIKQEKIGQGSFGEVYKGVDKLKGETVAIKVIKLEDGDLDEEQLRKEIALLSHCISPHIIRFRSSFLVEMELWIVMDYCELGSLRQLIEVMGPLSEAAVLFIAKDLIRALNYLHQNKIIHRDIKAANVVLDGEGRVKLGDFGVASHLQGQQKRFSMVGSPYWMAPEVITKSNHDEKADIWSLGITLYELLVGNPPLSHIEPGRAIVLISNNPPPRLDAAFSPDIKDLVHACLHDDPNQRPSAQDLLQYRAIKKAMPGVGASSPISSILEQYKIIRKNKLNKNEIDIDGSAMSRGDTLQSNWTFGTFKSDEYSSTNYSEEEEKEELNSNENNNNNETIIGGSNKTQLTPPKLSLLIPSTSTNNITRAISHFSIESQGTPDHIHRRVGSESVLSIQTSIHNNQHQTSIIPFDLEPIEDFSNDEQYPHLKFIRDQRAQRQERFDKVMDLLPIPKNINSESLPDKHLIYQLMASLKLALTEIPKPSDCRCDSRSIRETVRQHIEYNQKYLHLIREAINMLQATGYPPQ